MYLKMIGLICWPLMCILQQQPILSGRVLDPAGQPVREFEIVACLSREPLVFTAKKFRDSEGHFSLNIPTDWEQGDEGRIGLGIKAPGFAVWQKNIVDWQNTKEITARLSSGATVHGTVKLAGVDRSDGGATLVPLRDYTNPFDGWRRLLFKNETTIEADGNFRFTHVAPGEYSMSIAGRKNSTLITVFERDMQAGVFSYDGAEGVGSIAGIIRRDDGRVWPFAEGYVFHAEDEARLKADYMEGIRFLADEQGRFRVDGVPVGMVSVIFPFHETECIVRAHIRKALILKRKTTDVQFFDASREMGITCKFLIGDGSPNHFASGTGAGAKETPIDFVDARPTFNIELRPIENVPISFGNANAEWLDTNNQIHLRDVHPGRFRLLVGDPCGGTVYETTVDTRQGNTSCSIPLGAGSIKGAMQWGSEKVPPHWVDMTAVGKRTRTIRVGFCNRQTSAFACYLPEDEYAVWAHATDVGWCVISNVVVKNDIVDVGLHSLKSGGLIIAKVPPTLNGDPGVTAVAVDSQGIVIQRRDQLEPIGQVVAFSSLWPGDWTVTLKQGDRLIGKKIVTLNGTETVRCDLGD